jgi:hypothetical protein
MTTRNRRHPLGAGPSANYFLLRRIDRANQAQGMESQRRCARLPAADTKPIVRRWLWKMNLSGGFRFQNRETARTRYHRYLQNAGFAGNCSRRLGRTQSADPPSGSTRARSATPVRLSRASAASDPASSRKHSSRSKVTCILILLIM